MSACMITLQPLSAEKKITKVLTDLQDRGKIFLFLQVTCKRVIGIENGKNFEISFYDSYQNVIEKSI